MLRAGLVTLAIMQGLDPVGLQEPDLWWHLRTGEWVAAHHAVPATDPFSQYGAGREWVAYSWLFEALLYGAHRLGGLSGVVGLVAVLWLAIAETALWATRSLWVTLALLAALAPFATPRPWLFSMLLLLVELGILQRALREGRRRLLWALPVLFAVWANLHIQFVYGLAVLGVFGLFAGHATAPARTARNIFCTA